MASKKALTTPKGTAVWPKLNRPDTKFVKDGVYQVALKLDGQEAERFKKELNAKVKESVKEAKTKNKKHAKSIKPRFPYAAETDEEGDETGATLFKFKRNRKGHNPNTGESWNNTVKLFDAKGNPSKAKVGGGSTIVISYKARPYYIAKDKEAGITLDLLAVQVLELVQGGTAESYGFEKHDDGFEDDGSYEDDQDEETSGDDADESDDDDDASDEDSDDNDSDGEDEDELDF